MQTETEVKKVKKIGKKFYVKIFHWKMYIRSQQDTSVATAVAILLALLPCELCSDIFRLYTYILLARVDLLAVNVFCCMRLLCVYILFGCLTKRQLN